MKNVLEVKNISKSFKVYSSEWVRVFSWFGFSVKPVEEHHILKHINFSVKSGEAVGIVGQNGAGKSTLLKIITGTLKASEGTININGRISAILELGMGFHPDLTGRQNVYHSAGLMGFTKEQIDKVIDNVESFAEIGEYFDEPVRTYSSGMQMRVAFSVATMYRPVILIVDEALSVGDAYFQHKSFERIREFQKKGTTLLLVSHDRAAIQAICNRTILLDKGEIIKDGNPEEVMDFYNALIADKENSTIKQMTKDNGKVETISGTRDVSIEKVNIFNEDNKQVEYIPIGSKVKLQIQAKVNKFVPEIVVGYLIKDRLGQPIFGTNTYHYKKIIKNPKKDAIINVSFNFCMNLGIGSYSISIALHKADNHIAGNYEWRDQALIFNVVNTSKEEFVGSCWLQQEVEVQYVK